MLNRILVVWKPECRRPGKVLIADINRIQWEFKPFIINLSQIGYDICITCEIRQASVYQQVRCRHMVPFNATIDTVIQETEVQTDIPGCGSFPFQIRIGHSFNLQWRHFIQTPLWSDISIFAGRTSMQLGQGLVNTDIPVSILTPGQTQLTATHWRPLEELFIRETPCHGYGGECSPGIGSTESRETVATNRCGQHIAVVIRVE